jgi:hypothetical protein
MAGTGRLLALADRRRVFRLKEEPDTSSWRLTELLVYVLLSGKTEIHYFDPVGLVYHDVSGMDIGVNYSLVVQSRVRTEDVATQTEELLLTLHAAILMQLSSGGTSINALTPLKEKIRAAFPDPGIQERGANRASQVPEDCALTLEHPAAFGIGARSQYLEGGNGAFRPADLIDFAVFKSLEALQHFTVHCRDARLERRLNLLGFF